MGITDSQRDLIERIRAALSTDPVLDAAWLAGSLGDGCGDAFSDVDVLALAPAGKAGEVARRYSGDLSAIAEPLLVNVIAGRVVSVVATGWRRFDLTFVEAGELARYDRARLQPLFNRSGIEPPRIAAAAYQPSAPALEPLVSEFFRVLGLAVVALGRREHVLALSGVDILRRLTIDLMLEESGVGPAERGGALRRNPLLTAEQRDALQALPPVAADRDSLIAAETALAGVFIPRARRLADRIGMEWPARLEAAAHDYLREHLGVSFW